MQYSRLTMSVTIETATALDLRGLATVVLITSLDNEMDRKCLGLPQPGSLPGWEGYDKDLEWTEYKVSQWFGETGKLVFEAIDETTGEIVGYCVWSGLEQNVMSAGHKDPKPYVPPPVKADLALIISYNAKMRGWHENFMHNKQRKPACKCIVRISLTCPWILAEVNPHRNRPEFRRPPKPSPSRSWNTPRAGRTRPS